MSDIAIRVQGLSKQYRIGNRTTHYNTLRESLVSAATSPIRRLRRSKNGSNGPETIWALRDVSFEVQRGEVVGIIGRNGTGKSTLLKILSRITKPTSGRAEVYGRVGSLLEVGTGFHPELTGRENIYLNGAILGMRKSEIARKFDEIVAFAEIEKFLDTPVKHYSSGMYVRLAFAVAAHLEPEILLVDEVLAVGDLAFQKKCLGKMGDVAKEGRTVLFVSHNMQAVRSLCGRGLLLSKGQLASIGPTAEIVATYHEHLWQAEVNASAEIRNHKVRRGSGAVRFTGVHVRNCRGEELREFAMGESVVFWISYEAFADVPNLSVFIGLKAGPTNVFVTSSRHQIASTTLPLGHSGSFGVEFTNPVLRPGEYRIYLWLGNHLAQPYDVVDDLTAPLVIATDKGYDELEFDPSQPVGFFDIPSRLVMRAEGQD